MFKHKKTILLLLGILIIASFFRLYHITSVPPGLYPDEAMNGNNAIEALATGNYKVFYPENNGREGLFVNIQALFLSLQSRNLFTQWQPWMLRLPSAIFGILTVLGLFLMTRELFLPRHPEESATKNLADTSPGSFAPTKASGLRMTARKKANAIALLSSFLLATSFWHINFSRIGFRAIMAPALLTFALFFFLKALNMRGKSQAPSAKHQIKHDNQTTNNNPYRHSEEAKRPKNLVAIFTRFFTAFRMTTSWSKIGIWPLATISGLMLGLGAHSYIAYRIMPLLFLIFIPFHWRDKQFWQVLAVTAIFALVAAGPLLFYFAQNPADFLGRTSQISIFDEQNPVRTLVINTIKTIGMLFVVGDYNWRHNLSGAPQLYWPVAILFAVGIIAGCIAIWNRLQSSWKKIFNLNAKEKAIIFPYTLMFSWLVIAMLPVVISSEGLPHALRAILMIPPVIVLAGIGGWHIWKKTQTLPIKVKGPLSVGLMIILAILPLHASSAYFLEWGQSQHTRGAFNTNYVQLGNMLNNLPRNIPKYVLVNAGGVEVRGIPMPAQTVMYITNTFLPQGQAAKNIYYLLPGEEAPPGAMVFPLEN